MEISDTRVLDIEERWRDTEDSLFIIIIIISIIINNNNNRY